MTDIERGRAGGDEDRLPWLEPVEDEDEREGVGAGKLAALVIAALAAIGLIIGGVFWLRERSAPAGAAGEGGLIAAPGGDYKIPAAGPTANGMAIEGEGDATFAASEGGNVSSAIDISARPETPVAGGVTAVDAASVQPHALPPSKPVPPAAATTKPEPARPAAKPPVAVAKAEPARPAPVARPAPAKTAEAKPASGGGTIQLGAFGSEAKAKGEWPYLSRRFPELRGLSYTVSSVESNGKTLWRLRASGAGAAAACKAVKAGDKPCAVIGK